MEGSSGCIGIRKYNIFLGTTPAGGFASPGNTSICAPGGLNFILSNYANNTTGTTYSIIVNDGSAITTFAHPPPSDTITHFFANNSCGTSSTGYFNAFTATLKIDNPCLSTSVDVKPIYVSTKPRASMSVSPSPNVCTNATVTFANISSGGNTVTTQGQSTFCSNNGKQVWSISPSTGYNLVFGKLGDTRGNPSSSVDWDNGSSYINLVFTMPGIYTIKMQTGTDRCGTTEVVKTVCVRSAPMASFTMNKKFSCGIDTAIITNTSPVGGCLGDSYSWTVAYSDPSACNTRSGSSHVFINNTLSTSQHPNIQFLKPGRYIITLTVTAIGTSNTCPPKSVSDTFYLKAKPKVQVNTLSAICVGNTLSPTAIVTNCYGTDTLRYSWNFVNGTPAASTSIVPGAIRYDAIGNHDIILGVSNECGVTNDTVLAIVTATPAASAGVDTVVCSGVPVRIGANPVAGITYKWLPTAGLSSSTTSNPTATLTYTGVNADTTLIYVLTASAGANCVGSDTILITVKKKPIVSVSPSSASVCAGAAIQLVANGAATYLWMPANSLDKTNADTVVATPVNTTSYIVNGIGANGCNNIANALVTVIAYPNVNAGKDTLVCNLSTSIQLSAQPAGGVWSGHPNITTNGIFNPNAAGNGTYSAIYTASNGTCSRSDTMIITVIEAPIANAGADTVVCESIIPIQLSGMPAFGRWSGAFVTINGAFTPSNPGTYNLIYTVGSGTCLNRDTLQITVGGKITNNTIAADQSICIGSQPLTIIGSVALGGAGNITYQWQSSTDNINWMDVSGANAKDYTPSIPNDTIWYRRVATTILCNGINSNTSTAIRIIVNPNTVAAFVPQNTVGCAPFVITPAIINLTIDPSVGEYRWFVDNRYIGSGQNFPGHTIAIAGDSASIQLITVSRYGCKGDTAVRKFITVTSARPSFTQSDSIGCGPLLITFDNTTFNQAQYKFEWNFGQGLTSTQAKPAPVTFPVNPNFGDTIYTVTLKAISPCDTVTYKKQITVRAKPKVLFTPAKTEGCSPMKVTFTNTSRGSNATYTWFFGDGSLPVVTNNASIEHTFVTGVKTTFFVKLIGSNDCGSDSLIYAIVVNPNSIKLILQ